MTYEGEKIENSVNPLRRVSTGLAYRDLGRPLSEDDPLDTEHPYGASKAAADLLVRAAGAEFGVPVTVIRPFSFTGLGDKGSRLFPSLLRAAADQKALDLAPGLQVRDHCAAQDIAAGIIAAVGKPGVAKARIFNMRSGRSDPLRKMLEDVVSELGLNVTLNFGARDYIPFEPMFLVADIQRAETELGWRPRTNLAFAVWELARRTFPQLKLRCPKSSW